VAIYTAAQYPNLFRGVIIENTFTSMSDMVDHLLSYLRFIRGFILRNKWSSIDLVSQIKTPMLYITGDRDELVPFEMTNKLHDASTSCVHLKKVSNYYCYYMVLSTLLSVIKYPSLISHILKLLV
jgi:fermentation-respiration switch protein FrsA (DUF1100 family)